MRDTNYSTMSIEHLGVNATGADLAHFRAACRKRQAETGETHAQVTAWMWGAGDWSANVEQTLSGAEFWRGIYQGRAGREADAFERDQSGAAGAPPHGTAEYWRWLMDRLADAVCEAQLTAGE